MKNKYFKIMTVALITSFTLIGCASGNKSDSRNKDDFYFDFQESYNPTTIMETTTKEVKTTSIQSTAEVETTKVQRVSKTTTVEREKTTELREQERTTVTREKATESRVSKTTSVTGDKNSETINTETKVIANNFGKTKDLLIIIMIQSVIIKR